MEQYQFKIEKSHKLTRDELHKFNPNGVFLYILHADKIPPHIGLSIQHKFYSLKANAIDFRLDLSRFHQVIATKSIPTIMIELNFPQLTLEHVKEVFHSYGKKLSSGSTCLHPIDQLTTGEVKHEKIGELLHSLNEQQQIKKIFSYQISENYKGILNYSLNDIQKRIFELRC